MFIFTVYLLIFFDMPEYNSERKTIKVYVCGEVENPGVYELAVGSRVQDVLILAKPKGTADLESINLAKKLRDEDMIKVYPIKSAKIKININTSTVEELTKLPGISRKTAYKIVQYREKYGNFTNINELLRIEGITVEDLEEISKYVEF
ncbi:MAG: ComEA family DNA-binding protein [Candidatus Calescibacterium sp.]|nr:ComEA family DNA-binding protein [Candidatus Calescibacterium sp.]MDW8194963.1 ComEA family DNA-binding protein [Candidatus Calescibacterium sp.]